MLKWKAMMRLIAELFVPQEKNNFRAKILHPSFLALLVGIFLFNQTVLSLVALTKPGVLGYTSDITPEAIITLTNQERSKRGLPPLVENSLLTEAARRKAADMFAFDYWSHTSPTGRSPWEFFKEVGYNYVVAGENLAKDFADPESVIGAWMKSPTHQANIVDSRFKEIGVAVVEGTLNGYQTTLVVQLFGAQSKPVAKAVVEAKEKPVGVGTTAASVLSEGKATATVNPLLITKGISGFLFVILVGAILVDAYFIFRQKAHRFSGRNLAHAFFLALIFFLILQSQQGVIN